MMMGSGLDLEEYPTLMCGVSEEPVGMSDLLSLDDTFAGECTSPAVLQAFTFRNNMNRFKTSVCILIISNIRNKRYVSSGATTFCI